MKAIPKSAIEGISWPAVLPPEAATCLAVMYQLAQTQWWSPEQLRHYQFHQINRLLRHAVKTAAFYRDRLGTLGIDAQTEITPDLFSQIPLLRREDIQNHLKEMTSTSTPSSHGKVGVSKSSGSTGRPIQIYATSVSQLFWMAFSLRDHLWHQRDFSKKHAEIRAGAKTRDIPQWGAAVSTIFPTGPSAILNIKESIETQIQWVQNTRPAYLLSYPSNLRDMAQRCIEADIRFPGLEEIRTLGETVPDDLRALCRQAWNVDIKDMYSSMEIGYMALQCPGHDHYHIMSEGIMVEILDDNGRPCQPGEIGRVVVTNLHNCATPMIRYDLLDYAEVGEPCPCGRGLPVLKRIMGRHRNMMQMPNGTTRWPSFGMRQWPGRSKITQIQIIQEKVDHLLIRLVVKQPIDKAEEQAITEVVRQRADYPFQIDFEYPDVIEKPASLKRDLFICNL